MKVTINVLFLSVLMVSSVFAQDDTLEMDKTIQLTAFCHTCHGPEGSSINTYMPTIKGQSAEYLINSMADFASNARYGTLMGIVAKGYNADDIVLIANSFSKMVWTKTAVGVDTALAAKGAVIAEDCLACHGVDQADYVPKIEGQQPLFLYNALLEYKNGKRTGENVAEMEFVVDYSDEDLKALAEYFASITLGK